MSSSVGYSFFLTLLAVLFIGLKLTGTGVVAAWSWWWVLSPLWLGWAFILSILLLAVVITGIKIACSR